MDTDTGIELQPQGEQGCEKINPQTFSIDSILSHKMRSDRFMDKTDDKVDYRFLKHDFLSDIELPCRREFTPAVTPKHDDFYTISRRYVTMADTWNTPSSHYLRRKRCKDTMSDPKSARVKEGENCFFRDSAADEKRFYFKRRAYHFAEDSPTNSKLSFHSPTTDDDRHSKRRRTIFTANQLERLEYEFQQQQYIVGQERRYLARELGLNEVQVKVWFQNRRIKWRKYTHYLTDNDLVLERFDEE